MEPQRGFEPANLPITSRLRCQLRHWGISYREDAWTTNSATQALEGTGQIAIRV